MRKINNKYQTLDVSNYLEASLKMEETQRIKKIISDATTLLVARPDLALIGMVYYNMKKVFCNSKAYSNLMRTMGVPNSSLGFTNGNTITYLIHEKLEVEELIFITFHEVMHIISDHIKRRGDRHPILWNLAADHVINRLGKQIQNTNNIMSIPEGTVFFEDIHDKHPKCDAEEVYDMLYKNHKKRFSYRYFKVENGKLKEKQEFDSSDCLDDDSSQEEEADNNSSQDSNKLSKDKKKNEGKGKGKSEIDLNELGLSEEEKKEFEGSEFVEVTDTKTNEKWLMPLDTKLTPKEGESVKDVLDRLEDIRKNIKSAWNNKILKKGNFPGEYAEYLNQMFKVAIPWDVLLKDAILYPVQINNRSTWNYPNLTVRPTPAFRKSKIKIPIARLKGKTTRKSPFTLVCGVDSSGSITTNELKKFVGILCSSYSYFKKIVVFIHDHIVQDIIEIKNVTSEESVFKELTKIKGRGGTSHEDCFNKIEETCINEKVSSIVFLTDFYSDVESIYQNYEFLRNFETIWILSQTDIKEIFLNGCSTKSIKI